MRTTSDARQALDDAAWAAARRMERFGYAEISHRMQIGMKRASGIVRRWESEGRVRVVQQGPGLRRLFAPDADWQPPAPRMRGSVPENLWTSMRGLKSFTPTDLAAHSTTIAVKVSTAAAQAYCQALLRAGYLRVERKAVPGRREAIYRLVKSTGPKPPRERRVRAVIDDNLGEIVHIAGAGR